MFQYSEKYASACKGYLDPDNRNSAKKETAKKTATSTEDDAFFRKVRALAWHTFPLTLFSPLTMSNSFTLLGAVQSRARYCGPR